MLFLCQMVGGVEIKMCVPTGDVTPSVNKGCGPLLADRLSVWTAGLISASMLAHDRRMTPTQLSENPWVGEALITEGTCYSVGCAVSKLEKIIACSRGFSLKLARYGSPLYSLDTVSAG